MRFQVALRAIAADTVKIAGALSAVVMVTTSMVTFGSWSAAGSGSGYSKADSVPQSATPTQAITTWPNIAVSWTATTVGATTADSYTIRRYIAAGGGQVILANCSGAIAALTCTENTVPAGSWQYSTQARKGNWLGIESGKSTTVRIVAAPTVLACTSCATFGGVQKYINLAGKDAVTVTVGLAASSLANDTVNLSLTDAFPTAVSNNTTPLPSGESTITPAALNTTALIDGVVDASAKSTPASGVPSGATMLLLTRDIVVPTAANIKGNNGASATAKKLDATDTVVYTFSEAPDPASIKAGWNGTSTTVTASITNIESPSVADTVTVGTTNLGSVNTVANYVAGDRTCASTIALSGSVVTLTLGACNDTTRNNVATSAFIWTPSASALDQAQNPMSTTARTATTGSTVNF